MYVCLCHGVRDEDIRQAVEQGAVTLADLSARTGCATGCGCCAEFAQTLLESELERRVLPLCALEAA